MSSLLAGDIHLDKYEESIDEKIFLIEDILKNDVDRFIFLGDIFNHRKHVDKYAVEKLQDLFSSCKKEIYLIVGNHDTKFNNTLYPNSLQTSFKNISNVIVVDKPTEIDDFLLIPWINEENYLDCIDSIKKSKKKYCAGHFEINSFLMTRGIECRAGLKISLFRHFEKVFSGHYHLRQEKNNILYIGNIIQETWTDYLNIKGYYVVDDKITFIEHGKESYHYIVLENKKSDFDLDKYDGCMVKLFFKEKLTKKQHDRIEELKLKLKSYQVFDESVELVEVKIDKAEFKDVLDEFLSEQEMDDDLKVSINEYMLNKYKEEIE